MRRSGTVSTRNLIALVAFAAALAVAAPLAGKGPGPSTGGPQPAAIEGTNGPDRLVGTTRDEAITG
jgi:hypothetical protein